MREFTITAILIWFIAFSAAGERASASPHTPSQAQVDAALVRADHTMRKGIARLAKTYPDLRVTDAGPLAKALRPRDGDTPHELNLWVAHYASMTRPRPGSIQERHHFLVCVILRDPKTFDPKEQMLPQAIYPALRLSGRVGTSAANPKLSAALQKLVKVALAPIGRLEKQAHAVGAKPVP